MYNSRLVLPLALALAISSASCLFDSAVPVDGDRLPEIVCDQDSDCPSGWLCNPNLGRCLPAEQRDSEAPGLDGAPLLAPAVGSV
ncbi:MAG: hypothetical protein JXR83_21915, partial [Deltaproteobacteria bacterium]|nr:hypothetical protein [Deltaproteobacteria bacterium]